MKEKDKIRIKVKKIIQDRKLTHEFERDTRIITQPTCQPPYLFYYLDTKRLYRIELQSVGVDIQKIEWRELSEENIPGIVQGFFGE